MIIRKLAGAALSVLLFACSSGHQIPVMSPSADIDAPNTADAESVMKMTLALQPEVTDSSLISYMRVAGILDGDFYIGANNLMTFGKNGKCISSFNHVGQGPEEYGEYDSSIFDRFSRRWIMVSSSMLPVLKSYSPSGEYISTDTIISSSNLKQIKEGWIATNNGLVSPELTLYYYDRDFNLTDSVNTRFMHRVYSGNNSKTGLQCYLESNGEEAYIIRHDTVFNLTNPKVEPTPVAVVDFSAYTLPEDVDIMKQRDWYEKYVEPDYIFSKDYIMVWYRYDKKIAMRVYDIKNGNLVLALTNPLSKDKPGLEVNYDGRNFYLGSPSYVSGNTFYLTISDSQMSELTGDEDANPALMAVEVASGSNTEASK